MPRYVALRTWPFTIQKVPTRTSREPKRNKRLLRGESKKDPSSTLPKTATTTATTATATATANTNSTTTATSTNSMTAEASKPTTGYRVTIATPSDLRFVTSLGSVVKVSSSSAAAAAAAPSSQGTSPVVVPVTAVKSAENHELSDKKEETDVASSSKPSASHDPKEKEQAVPVESAITSSSSLSSSIPTGQVKKEGCQKCGRDDNYFYLLLCEYCNDEYHTYCLDPPLESVPEGDFVCEKCKNLKIFCRNDNLDVMVAALPPAFTQRFGEIVWAYGGNGFGWWPSCIYDPRLTVGGARKLALKNIGKKHLVYFFGCSDTPFTVLPDNKCLAWEEGLMEEYDLGKTAKAMGKARTMMFEWALQAATVENDKPIEYRLDWNHQGEDSSNGIYPPPLNGLRVQSASRKGVSETDTVEGKKRQGGGLSNASKSVGGQGGEVGKKLAGSKTKNNKDHSTIERKPPKRKKTDSKVINDTKDGISAKETLSSPSRTGSVQQPTRKSNRERKPSRSFEDSSSVSPISSNSLTTDGKSSPSQPIKSKKRNRLEMSESKSPDDDDAREMFCKICRNDQIVQQIDCGDTAFSSSSIVGFVKFCCDESFTFRNAREIIERDLDEGSLPVKWKFFLPNLGPMSWKQEVTYGHFLQLIANTIDSEKFGDGSYAHPLKLFVYQCE